MNYQKIAGLILLGIGACAVASAGPVPEIDPAFGVNALALAAGALLIIRSRRK